jgi:hypothetical protein
MENFAPMGSSPKTAFKKVETKGLANYELKELIIYLSIPLVLFFGIRLIFDKKKEIKGRDGKNGIL